MTDSAMEWAIERERELRKWSYLEYRVRDIGLNEAGIFACENPEEQWVREMEEAYAHGVQKRAEYDAQAYDLNDPKHPDFHSVHADVYDIFRDGK